MSDRRLSIRVSNELARQLAAMARSTGRSESDIAREAIADYCAKETAQPTVYDLMKKSGLIGCARGMPSDLATNPKYMEGFGRE